MKRAQEENTTYDADLTATPSLPRQHMVTVRSVLVALVLMPLNAYWIILMEVTRYSGHPTTISLFFNVVFLLTVLIGLNALIGRLWPRARLEPGELLTIYILLVLASGIAGHDMIEVLLPILSHAHYFATPENDWGNTLVPHIPRWLSVSDPQALKEFYEGNASLYHGQNLRAWAGPVLWWVGFLVLLGFLMLCLNSLLRRQWTESEKLPFPLVSLPLEMVNPQTQLFRNRLFWLGVAVAASVELWNGLAYLYPSLPTMPLKRFGMEQDVNSYLPTPPWRAIEGMSVALYPFGIGLGMLLPLDLLFSSWLFAWIWQMERVVGAVYGFGQRPGYPFVEAQSCGAYLGLAISALWVSRRPFLAIWRGLFERGADLKDAGEPLPYRWAAIGLACGSIVLFTFCLIAGMTLFVTITFFLVYFLLAIAITRVRAELGPPAHDFSNAGPDEMLPSLVPPNDIGTGNLTMFSMFYGFNRAYRGHPMPIQLEGFKMAERTGVSYRPLFWAMLLAIGFGALCGFWADLDQSYRYGAAGRMAPPNVQLIFGSEPWNRMQSWITSPPSAQKMLDTRIAISVGFGVSLLLNILRLRIPGFILHPVGYAISSNWSMGLLWLPLMIAWAIKLALLRYGGLRAYRFALPFFFGLVLGEAVLGSLWALIGIALDAPTYAFWP